MNKVLLLLVFVSACMWGNAQQGEVWNTVGAKYKFTKQIQVSGSFSCRWRDLKARTLFPELTLKYTIAKWVNVSLDYRYVSKREDNGNYLGANRLNFNARFKNSIDRLGYGIRARYQMSSSSGASGSYNSDFDEAIRLRPGISYDIKNSMLTPYAMVEGFYNPGNGQFGKRIDKFRYTLGTDFEFDGPHEFSCFLRLDRRLNANTNKNRFILGVSYQLYINKMLGKKVKKGDL